MRRMGRSTFDVLADALRDPQTITASISDDGMDRLAAAAEFHRVGGQLAATLRAAGHQVPPALDAARTSAMARHLRHVQALERLAAAFDDAGIRWLVLKGPILAARWYRDPAARDYYDLDVLVDPSQLAEAIRVLTTVGFVEHNRNWRGFRSLGLGEVPLVDDAVVVDLHWHVLPFAKDRRLFAFPTADALDRRVGVKLGSLSAWSLADDDLAAHLVLHTGLAGARLLVHLRDVQVVVSRVNPELVVARMRAIGMERLASATIERVERLLGPLAPGALAPSVDHDSWRALNRRVDLLWARASHSHRKPYPSALIASARPTVRATAREAVDQTLTSLRRRTGHRTLTTPGGPLTWEVDAGGAAERARFLREVETGVFGS